MVIGTIEIENKADVISISYMVYNAKKGSRFFRHGLFFIGGRTGPAQLGEGGIPGVTADLGSHIPVVLYFTRPSMNESSILHQTFFESSKCRKRNGGL